MLIRFRVANHRSIHGEYELSLIATEFDEGTARGTGLRHRGRDVSAQPVVGVFGANASGKSNLLSGFRLMRDAVGNSFADWAKTPDAVPRQPFKLDSASREETTLFEVDLVLGQDPVRAPAGETPDADLLWMQIVQLSPWPMSELETRFAEAMGGVTHTTATEPELDTFLRRLKNGDFAGGGPSPATPPTETPPRETPSSTGPPPVTPRSSHPP